MLKRIKKLFAKNKKQSEKPKTESKNNPYVKIIAERTGHSYDEEIERMRHVRDTYGISFGEYVSLKCDKCKTEEDYLAKVRAKEKRTEKAMAKLIAATGWSEEKAAAAVEHAREKFGISAKKYYSEAFYMLDDEGIEAALEKQRDELKEELKNTGESEYIREQARKQLRLLNPGEILFTFED